MKKAILLSLFVCTSALAANSYAQVGSVSVPQGTYSGTIAESRGNDIAEYNVPGGKCSLEILANGDVAMNWDGAFGGRFAFTPVKASRGLLKRNILTVVSKYNAGIAQLNLAVDGTPIEAYMVINVQGAGEDSIHCVDLKLEN